MNRITSCRLHTWPAVKNSLKRSAPSSKLQAASRKHRFKKTCTNLVHVLKIDLTERYNMKDKEAIIEEVIAICKANKKNMYCDKYQLIDMIREVLKLYEN